MLYLEIQKIQFGKPEHLASFFTNTLQLEGNFFLTWGLTWLPRVSSKCLCCRFTKSLHTNVHNPKDIEAKHKENQIN